MIMCKLFVKEIPVISVVPRLVIAEVKVEGNESIPSEAIREKLESERIC